jgi:hypothetical protein
MVDWKGERGRLAMELGLDEPESLTVQEMVLMLGHEAKQVLIEKIEEQRKRVEELLNQGNLIQAEHERAQTEHMLRAVKIAEGN